MTDFTTQGNPPDHKDRRRRDVRKRSVPGGHVDRLVESCDQASIGPPESPAVLSVDLVVPRGEPKTRFDPSKTEIEGTAITDRCLDRLEIDSTNLERIEGVGTGIDALFANDLGSIVHRAAVGIGDPPNLDRLLIVGRCGLGEGGLGEGRDDRSHEQRQSLTQHTGSLMMIAGWNHLSDIGSPHPPTQVAGGRSPCGVQDRILARSTGTSTRP